MIEAVMLSSWRPWHRWVSVASWWLSDACAGVSSIAIAVAVGVSGGIIHSLSFSRRAAQLDPIVALRSAYENSLPTPPPPRHSCNQTSHCSPRTYFQDMLWETEVRALSDVNLRTR